MVKQRQMSTEANSLREILSDFSGKMRSVGRPREGVSVHVARRLGFQNAARTTSGHAFLLDEPSDFGGLGEAPDPAEYLLAAIGASMSVTLTAHAALRAIAIDHIEMTLSADIDARSFFEPGRGHRAGLLDLCITLEIVSPASLSALRRLTRDVTKAAPVLRSLKRLPRISLTIRQP